MSNYVCQASALVRRLGLDVVLTVSERAALWGPPEVAYVYEHPKYRTRRARDDSDRIALLLIKHLRPGDGQLLAGHAEAYDLPCDLRAGVRLGVHTPLSCHIRGR